MFQVTLTDNIVTAAEPLEEGVTVMTLDAQPRIGSVSNGKGGWMASSWAALVDDGTKVVSQVSRNKWADEQTPVDGATWVDTDQQPVAGQIMQDDGTFENPPLPRNIAAEASEYATALKVGVVNATKTDGGPDFPATEDGVAQIDAHYRKIKDRLNTKAAAGLEITDEEKGVLQRILAGEEFWDLVDQAMSTVSEADPETAADPISDHPAWPDLPAG